MRKPNLELNRIKLQQKQLQLSQIENQFNELSTKLAAVAERIEAKKLEVTHIETLLSEAASPVVS